MLGMGDIRNLCHDYIIMIIDIITIFIRLTVTVLQASKFTKKFIEVAKIRCHELANLTIITILMIIMLLIL